MQVAKRLKEDWLTVLQLEFLFKTTLYFFKNLNTTGQEYEAGLKLKNLNVCVAMCSLVMSLNSRDFLVTSS